MNATSWIICTWFQLGLSHSSTTGAKLGYAMQEIQLGFSEIWSTKSLWARNPRGLRLSFFQLNDTSLNDLNDFYGGPSESCPSSFPSLPRRQSFFGRALSKLLLTLVASATLCKKHNSHREAERPLVC